MAILLFIIIFIMMHLMSFRLNNYSLSFIIKVLYTFIREFVRSCLPTLCW